MRKIVIPNGIKYLSEYMQDLPHNVIFDKGIVGCGGTTIAIKNSENYVIAVPYVSLVENKIKQNPDVLGVYSKTKDKDIVDYLNDNSKVHKIMTTYDSLCRVVDLIKCNSDTTKYRLLVDEYHLLFTNYSFRFEAVTCVLENYTKFKSFCFMTATLLEDDFILKELQHIPIVEAEWSNTKIVTVNSMKCSKSVVPTVSNIILKYLDGTNKGNAYFFVNSVDFIKEMVKLLNLTNENTRGIWSKYNKTNVGIKLGTTTDSPKKINFLTSTCFEGADLYDEDAKIYIVSDKSKAHTLVDISTSFQQIACRVRNTKYGELISHIYTTTRYDVELTYNQFKQETTKGIKQSIEETEELNQLSERLREKINVEEFTSYILKRGNQFIYDENLVKIDLYNYKITKCLYKLRVNLNEQYKQNGFQVEEIQSQIKQDFNVSNVFKEVAIECKKQDNDYLKWAFSKYPFLETAIKYIGWQKMEELNYDKSHIKRYASKFLNSNQHGKIKHSLATYNEIVTGVFISKDNLKRIFEEIYNELDIIKSPIASDITEYYNVKPKQKMKKGIVENGYIILN